MESTESRFAHLLQPIRELTKNWDIDVAAALNDYLEEVKYCSGVTGGAARPFAALPWKQHQSSPFQGWGTSRCELQEFTHSMKGAAQHLVSVMPNI